ncbi:MAG: hypothetical protein COA34_013535 [Methylophaga sp.]|uniref:hypothetical protein n=1 Tax=Methylophaga sp. TaxID=2024840 RepID=UPI00216CB73D|nr:hypothetical protein [Methylophaga sp.]MBL1458857.1 hypothetical protein [Methylophaga sp.]
MNRDLLKSKGWRFASCFNDGVAALLCERIQGDHRIDNCFYINVTQDCSIINPNIDAEPFIEYLTAIPIPKENGMFINARNIRKLHIEIDVNGQVGWYELNMGLRGFISRENIDGCDPSLGIKLTPESERILKRWLANRYIAQTFPDDFNAKINHLLKNSKAPLVKIFDSDIGRACHSILISLDPNDRDLEKGESYDVVLVLLFSEAKAKEIGFDAMDFLANEVEKTLINIDGIGPVSVNSLSESSITFEQVVKMVRWQFDYISLANDAQIVPIEHASI